MKKFALGAIAAIVATVALSPVAEAAPNWRNRGWHGGAHHGWNNRGWNNRGWHNGWRNHAWRNHRGWGWGGYWGGPRVVIGVPVYGDYCFVKKVRHHDNHGNVYIKRVRVCR